MNLAVYCYYFNPNNEMFGIIGALQQSFQLQMYESSLLEIEAVV